MSGWHCFSFKEGLSYRQMPCLKAWPTRGTHTQWLIMMGLKTWCPWLTRGQLQWAMLALGLLVGCTEATSQFHLLLCLIASASLILQVLIPNKYLHDNPHFRVCFFEIQTDKKWSKNSGQYGGILELHLPITDGIWTTDAQGGSPLGFSSVQSLSHVRLFEPHEPQRARSPCPSTTPRVHPNPCPLSWWCHPTVSSSVIPVSSCPQCFPVSGSFQMSQLFASSGQSIGVSASTSVLPMTTQDWSPLVWTGWISLQSKGLSRVFSNTTVQKHQFWG